MEKLSDFKPLKSVVLPGLGELNCAGLTIIVGPNSSGKTQLLRDIKGKVAGEARNLVVATELEIEIPELEPFIKCLNSPLKKAPISEFHPTATHNAAKAVSPSSETVTTI